MEQEFFEFYSSEEAVKMHLNSTENTETVKTIEKIDELIIYSASSYEKYSGQTLGQDVHSLDKCHHDFAVGLKLAYCLLFDSPC